MPSEQETSTIGEQYDLPKASGTTTISASDLRFQSVDEATVELVPALGDPVEVPDVALSVSDGEIVIDHYRVMQELGVSEPARTRVTINNRVEMVKRAYVNGALTEQEFESRLETAVEIENNNAE